MSKNKDIVAFDLSPEDLVLVHARNISGKNPELQFLHYPVKDTSEDDVAKIFKKAIEDLKLKNPRIISVIPLNLTITKNLEIPSLNPQEIKEIVDLQSGRQTPYSREEIIIDYVNIGTYRQNYTKILLVIVTRNAVKKQFDLIHKAGGKVDEVYFAPEGISANCVQFLRGELPGKPVAVVHVDLRFTDFIVCLKGLPIFTRNIPLGAIHFEADKEKSLLKFQEEIKRSLETYLAEDIESSLQNVLVCGAINNLPGIEKTLSDVLKTPVQKLDYFEQPQFGLSRLSLPPAAGRVSFYNLLSVILSLRSLKVSLIPEEVKMRRAFEERAHEMIKMSVYFLVMFLLVGGIFIAKFYFQNLYLQKLRDQFKATNEEAVILENAMERIRIVKHHLKSRGYALQVLEALYQILPDRIMLTDIKMDASGNFNMKGTAKAMSDVFSFVVKLEESEFFSNVQTNYTTSRKEKDEDWADFGITCVVMR